MIKSVLNVANQHGDRYPRIYVTRTHDSKKNPLDIGKKLTFLRASFPGIEFKDVKNIIEAIQDINEEGIKYPIIVSGIDRAPSYKKIMQQGIEEGHTNFENFKIISLPRDPDSDNIVGASATKARQYAKKGDLESFKKISPSKLNDKQTKMLYDLVREGMGVK